MHVLQFSSIILPHVTKQLYKQATLRVDILGFTEEELTLHFNKHCKVNSKELTQHFKHHLTIGSLCYVPFNLVVLLYQGISLFKNCATINFHLPYNLHLTKHGYHLQSNITKVTDLPEFCNKIVQQLSKLSLQALNDKLIFTIDELVQTLQLF